MSEPPLVYEEQAVRERLVRRLLIAGVGYSNLRDMSAGPALAERLRHQPWPSGVEVEDLSLGAVMVLHWLQNNPPFDAALFLTAAARGREPGSIQHTTWAQIALPPDDVQQRVAEAVTGIISLENLLTVAGYFGALPPRVHVFEIEPRDDDWGPTFSPEVEAAMAHVETLVRRDVQELLA